MPEPAEWRARAATAYIGAVMWELIEPVDEDDLFGRFLAERGRRLVLTGEFTGINVSYLPTQQDLGACCSRCSRASTRPMGAPPGG